MPRKKKTIEDFIKDLERELKTELNVSDSDIAWMAGLIEGEGSFLMDNRNKIKYKTSNSPGVGSIRIGMTDKDTLDKFKSMVNKSPFKENRKTSSGKDVWNIYIGSRSSLNYLLPKIFPYLSSRRKEQAQPLLDSIDQWKKWILSGGKSEAAAEGGRRTAQNKKLKSEKKINNQNNNNNQ